VWDNIGEPAGYARFTPETKAIGNAQEHVYEDLPESFTFGKRKRFYGRQQDEATAMFLHKLMRGPPVSKHGARLFLAGSSNPTAMAIAS